MDSIHAFSGIRREFLSDFARNSSKASIAMKMSWASKRETEREEDMAYYLSGIFDVTMDVRYGVGGKEEFRRLQETIMHNSGDESIFALTSDDPRPSGLLAPWPDCFKNSGNIWLRPEKYRSRGPYEMTNQGLCIPVPIYIAGGIEHNDLVYAVSR